MVQKPNWSAGDFLSLVPGSSHQSSSACYGRNKVDRRDETTREQMQPRQPCPERSVCSSRGAACTVHASECAAVPLLAGRLWVACSRGSGLWLPGHHFRTLADDGGERRGCHLYRSRKFARC